jgi:hypothetical protein
MAPNMPLHQTEVPEPGALGDRPAVIAALRNYFSLDGAFLEARNLPLATCQETYRAGYDPPRLPMFSDAPSLCACTHCAVSLSAVR